MEKKIILSQLFLRWIIILVTVIQISQCMPFEISGQMSSLAGSDGSNAHEDMSIYGNYLCKEGHTGALC